MLASKPGKAKVSLKLIFKDDVPAGGLLFTFTAPSKETDRKDVQDILIPFVSANKGIIPAAAGPSVPTPTAVPAQNGSPAISTPGTPADGTPSAVAKGKRKAEDTPMTPQMSEAAKVARKAENRLKMKVLSKNPNLKMLHRELVLAGQISEKEFWEGREVSFVHRSIFT